MMIPPRFSHTFRSYRADLGRGGGLGTLLVLLLLLVLGVFVIAVSFAVWLALTVLRFLARLLGLSRPSTPPPAGGGGRVIAGEVVERTDGSGDDGSKRL